MPLSLLLLTFSVVASDPAPLPSIVVLKTAARQGISEDSGDLLSAMMTAHLKASRKFSTVVGTAEVESVLTLEKQRQLMECDAQGCMAELAGALGADYLVTSSVGKLGNSIVFTVSVVDARTARISGTVTETIPGTDEANLAAAMPDIVRRLVDDANPAGPAPAPATVARPPLPPPAQHPAPPPATPKAPTPPQAEHSSGPRVSSVVGLLAIIPGCLGVCGGLTVIGSLVTVVGAVAAAILGALAAAGGAEDEGGAMFVAGFLAAAAASVFFVVGLVGGAGGLGIGGLMALVALAGRGGEAIAEM